MGWMLHHHIYIYIYIYIITTFWFLILRTQLTISHTFSKWAPMSLQVIFQSPLLELLLLSSFWLWSNFLKAFANCNAWGFVLVVEQSFIFVISWHCLCSIVNSSIWGGNQRWVWSGGSWCFHCFKCSSLIEWCFN